MTEVPLYDDSVPIACTATSDEIPIRVAMLERMRSSLRSVERIDHGVMLHFPAEAAVEADVRQFVVDEKQCCQFWGFEVDRADDTITLRWEGPPSADGFLDGLITFFESDQPFTAFVGLL